MTATAGAGTGGGPGDAQFFPPGARGTLSNAVRVGNMLYLSGQLGSDSAAGGIQGETRSSLMKIKTLLERYGSSMDRVVKCTVFLLDMSEWSAMNQVYVTFFPTNRPARSAIGTNGLVGGARVEIECFATVP
jgi:2-iminobutanoate/2-iminopropanoate deaminase